MRGFSRPFAAASIFLSILMVSLNPISEAADFKTWIPHPEGGSLPLYCFLPSKAPRFPLPAVIVGVGVGATQIPQYHDHCRNLAERNFFVVFIDPSNQPEILAPAASSWDRGIGYILGSINQGVVGARLFFQKEWYLNSIKAAVDYLCGQPMVDRSRIALSGFSQPANAALTYACRDPRIKAVIWNYGGWPWIMPYDPMRLPPVQIFHGDKDEVYDVKYARQLALDMQAAMKYHELNIYPGQKHMFNIYYDLMKGENRYMRPALLDAFERLVSFLNRILAVPCG